MKTKFLSAILALMMLCPVFSASTSVAAADLGDDLSKKFGSELGLGAITTGYSVSFPKENGFGGKSEEELIQTFILNSEIVADTATKGAFPRFEVHTGTQFKNNDSGLSTFQFDIYADGNVAAGFTFEYSDVLVWNPDGNLVYVYGNAADDKNYNSKSVGNFERGKWYTVALTYDHNTSKQKVYINGTLIGDSYRQGGNSTLAANTTMKIGAYAGSKKGGKIAIDNVFAYSGGYDPSVALLEYSDVDDLMVDSTANSIMYNEEVIAETDVQLIKEKILSATGAVKAEFYNADFSASVKDKITENVALTTKGDTIYYFSVHPMYRICTPELVSDAGMVGAKAVVYNYHAQPKTLTMIMAIRDAQGSLEKVYSTQSYDVSGEKTFTIDPVYAGDGSAYVFFIENWETLRVTSDFVVKIK